MDDTSDFVAVERYGRANPGVFGGVWFDRDRLQIRFTVELELHEARLRPLLTLPDRVDVVSARWTVGHLNGVRAKAERIVAAHPGLARSSGMGLPRVFFDLLADGEAVAADLHIRFGGALALTVGGIPTRGGLGHRAGAAHCHRAIWGRRAMAAPGQRRSAQRRRPDGHLRGPQRDDGTGAADGGPTQIATVLDEHGAVAGTFDGFPTDEGMHRVVGPDRIIYLPVLGGTAGTDTYATPPGRYRVVAYLDVAEDDGIGASRLVSPPSVST